MSSPQELRDRTKAFAVRIVRLYRSLPYRTDAQVLGKQLIRSGTAVAANYRAACRASLEGRMGCKDRRCSGGSRRNAVLARNANGLRDRCPPANCRHLSRKDTNLARSLQRLATRREVLDGKKLQITRLQNYKFLNA